VRLGLLRQDTGKFPTIEVTAEGMAALKDRRKITLTKPMAAPVRRSGGAGEIACDEILFDRLRILRKQLADERKVPAYVIFGDATLRQMAREYPDQEGRMEGIFGMGEKKRAEFGSAFASAIATFLETNPRMTFNE
jgi:ATP-dependent DNA helicase RecQ